jgi:hypothetical protein
VPQPSAVGLGFCCHSQVRKNIIREEIESQVPTGSLSESVFKLNAGLGRKFQLEKGVGDVILLVIVGAKPVRLKVRIPEAKGRLVVDAGDHTFATERVILPA